MFQQTPRRLCCTATPAPNDIAELANHAEFLGVMSRAEMLATFFVHDEAGWRLKGHAIQAFYRWLTSWACFFSSPHDLGFDHAGAARREAWAVLGKSAMVEGVMMYLWRMTQSDRWLAYDSERHPMPVLDDDSPDQVIELPQCAYYAEAKAEAERMNRARTNNDRQGELRLC